MARTKGSVAFPFNFEIGAQSPMDARLVVASKEDLIAASTYSAKNYYKGMQVVVANTQEVYILKDVSKITSPDYSGWTRVDGRGSKVTVIDNLTSSSTTAALSAKQGLVLATMINALEDDKETYRLLKTLKSGTLSTQSEIDAILGPYSSFNAALNAGKVIHGIYKDGSNRLNTVAFSAFNDTTANRVRMCAMLDSSTMVAVLANHNGTNWISATIDEGSLGGGIIIE